MTDRTNFAAPADPLNEYADPSQAFKNPDHARFLSGFIEAVRQQLQSSVQSNQGAPHVILMSPNGTGYRVTVADDGTVTTAPARG
jgi:hypothetical protein